MDKNWKRHAAYVLMNSNLIQKLNKHLVDIYSTMSVFKNGLNRNSLNAIARFVEHLFELIIIFIMIEYIYKLYN